MLASLVFVFQNTHDFLASPERQREVPSCGTGDKTLQILNQKQRRKCCFSKQKTEYSSANLQGECSFSSWVDEGQEQLKKPVIPCGHAPFLWLSTLDNA